MSKYLVNLYQDLRKISIRKGLRFLDSIDTYDQLF